MHIIFIDMKMFVWHSKQVYFFYARAYIICCTRLASYDWWTDSLMVIANIIYFIDSCFIYGTDNINCSWLQRKKCKIIHFILINPQMDNNYCYTLTRSIGVYTPDILCFSRIINWVNGKNPFSFYIASVIRITINLFIRCIRSIYISVHSHSRVRIDFKYDVYYHWTASNLIYNIQCARYVVYKLQPDRF